jgi:hypothetical protein
VNRPGSVALLAATALLIGSAAVGCARNNGGAGTTAGSSIAVQATPAAVATASAPTPIPPVETTASPSNATPSVVPTDAAPATADPIDSALLGLDQLLSGVNSSLSGSDTASSGGE